MKQILPITLLGAVLLVSTLVQASSEAYKKKHPGDESSEGAHLRQQAGAGNLAEVKEAIKNSGSKRFPIAHVLKEFVNLYDAGDRTALWYAKDGLNRAQSDADKKRYQDVIDFLEAHGAKV